jgi:hypothetical protein
MIEMPIKSLHRTDIPLHSITEFAGPRSIKRIEQTRQGALLIRGIRCHGGEL